MTSLIEYPAADTCLLYLVRHGATPHNLLAPPRLQGSGINESLADLGREQAARAARLLAERPIKGVYSSPLKRAVETAEIIATPHGLSVEATPAFAEVHVGRWEGRTWDEIRAEDAQAYELYLQDPLTHGYPEGETGRQLVDRVTQAMLTLMSRHEGQEVVVVAHSVVNRLYLGSLLGVTPEQSHITPQSNCGISTVRCRRAVAKVLTLNATAHLM
jgi:broad specificity phosphatase PhoE